MEFSFLIYENGVLKVVTVKWADVVSHEIFLVTVNDTVQMAAKVKTKYGEYTLTHPADVGRVLRKYSKSSPHIAGVLDQMAKQVGAVQEEE